MFGLEFNDQVVMQQNRVLEQALSTNPQTQAALRKLINQALIEARANAVKNLTFQNGDPRHSAEAIRRAVYKKILGGNLNIYNRRRGSAKGGATYEPPRNPSPRGGNRMRRSQATQRMMSYAPVERGMVLRWVNAGTQDRYAGHGRNGTSKLAQIAFAESIKKRGNRGSISARNFFTGAADPALTQATETLSRLIDEQLENILNKKK